MFGLFIQENEEKPFGGEKKFNSIRSQFSIKKVEPVVSMDFPGTEFRAACTDDNAHTKRHGKEKKKKIREDKRPVAYS